MTPLGEIWGIGLTLDARLTTLLLSANLAFALAFALFSFRGRRLLDRALITAGLFLLLTMASLAGMHVFARTPVRHIDVFVVD